MIVGIDVYHSLGESNSWCGFISSVDRECTKWYSQCRDQKQNQREMIDKLADMTRLSLKNYLEVNGFLPNKIIVYRDGVGDSRLDFCLEYEISQIKDAFKSFGPDYQPPITAVIVSKRVNIRMLHNIKGQQREGGEYANPPPGTVLDHTVTRKDRFDFYLVSQVVTSGTVTPSHYIAITDECNLGPEKLQKLTYRLTYMYYNWKGPVRVPAPCLVRQTD